jgi:hypothetical protein
MYKIYYMNNYKTWANTRDQAVAWILSECESSGASFEDFEILDGSDFL